MGDLAIRVEDLSKRYRIGLAHRHYDTLRDHIADGARSLLRRNGRASGEEARIWALRDVSFEVEPGEVVGIIGRNGAGKSTLLKILSRITLPTGGQAEIHGRVGSLLEVGVAFHPELTGRENVYLSGAIIGMRKREIDRKFDQIVSFSEVEKFLDTPVKRYSSGMYVRLAFAVAAHLEPEILLVDEVLAVGDAAFQKKCLGKMSEVAAEGRTVLFVSHGMDAVRSLCDRVLWLDQGRLRADGEGQSVVSEYLDATLKAATEVGSDGPRTRRGTEELLRVEAVVLRDWMGRATNCFLFGSDVCVEVHFYTARRIERPHFWIGIGEESSLTAAMSLLDGIVPEAIESDGIMRCTFSNLALLPRFYNVFMGVRDQTGTSDIFRASSIASFEIKGEPRELGLEGKIADAFIRTCAPVFSPYRWELPDGTEVNVNLKRQTG